MSLYLPHVKNVAVPAINIIAVQNQIAVASIEVSMHFRFHLHHLQILNAPQLRMEKSLEMTLTDDFFMHFLFYPFSVNYCNAISIISMCILHPDCNIRRHVLFFFYICINNIAF